MDFMRLLKSIEELLYEIVTWLVFYPLTVVRIALRPLHMMAYAERELRDAVEDQYDDALSPPICLLITLVLLHLTERWIVGANAPALPGPLADDRNLLVFRAVAFGLFPLLLSVAQLRLMKARLMRKTLRPVFYGQCYAAIPFVIAITASLQLLAARQVMPGLVTLLAGLGWYVVVQALWFRREYKTSHLRAVSTAILSIIASAILVIALGLLTSLALSQPAPG
ncbi:hypothetical protein SAMN02983003_2137 [Devosia enhydra]|uniref:Yip1 domain-containing protein n=1 Tax=Devosia enhydra TaxID=665118 RepID=A0A1K2HZM4_9HYPH|nr:hypothetical protein [Devosia enhydra]SFZ84651.1 hypothetical protein SAMN02983003_2137 [Devosia enhydra]